MKNKARFIKSAVNINDWINDDVTEFVFIGRSNCGKSSLINALAQTKIAKTSKTPGRTQTANFYDFGSYRLIDLPGYGYAKTSQQTKANLIDVIDSVITTRKNVFGIFQICDANVLTQEDTEMHQYLCKKFKYVYLLLNKADRFALKHYQLHLNKVSQFFHTPLSQILLISVKKNININQVNSVIKKLNNIG